jgi:DNA end-binding protein Ku
VGIGTVVMRRKQYLAAIRPLDGALAISTMRFADEIVDRSQIDDLPSSRAKPDAKELKLATGIVDALATDWDPERYRDTYTDELKDLLGRKAKGETITTEEAEPAQAEVIDLMAALERSVEAARSGRGGRRGRTKRPAAKAAKSAKSPARKTAAKRAPKKTAAKASAKKASKRRTA